MNEKLALLEKMKKELEYKRKKLEKIQRSIKIKIHIKNKLNENESSELLSDCSSSQSISNYDADDNLSNKSQQTNIEPNTMIVLKRNLNEVLNNFNLDPIVNKEITNGSIIKSELDHHIPITTFKIDDSKNANCPDEDVLNLTLRKQDHNDLTLREQENLCFIDHNDYPCDYFTKYEEDKYYRFELNKNIKSIRYVEAFQNLIIICLEKTIYLFSFDNFVLNFKNHWSFQNLIEYVSFVSINSFLVVIKEYNYRLIFVYKLTSPIIVKLVASYKVWTAEIHSIICNPISGLYCFGANSKIESLSYSNASLENLIIECNSHKSINDNTADIHTVISKLLFNEFDEVSTNNCIIDFKFILSMSYVVNEPLLCLFNQDGTLLFWNYSSGLCIYSIDTLLSITCLDHHSYYQEGMLYISYSTESTKNILAINPNTHRYLSIYPNQLEKFKCLSVLQNLKIFSTQNELIFNKLCNEKYFAIDYDSMNLEKNLDAKILSISNKILIVLYGNMKLNLIVLK